MNRKEENWSKCGKVAASLTDYAANLSVVGALKIVEDSITEFMGDLHIDGLTAKREYNAVWVFSKTKTAFLKSLAWNDEYTVTCFFSKIANATLNIDVGILHGESLCVYARTEICALDLTTGRIRKTSSVGVGDFFTRTPLVELSFTEPHDADLPVAEKVKVRFTDIDYAAHTNNIQYVGYMLNTYSVRQMEARPVRELEIAYQNQSYEGDELHICKGSLGDTDAFILQKGDKTIVKCKIRFAQ